MKKTLTILSLILVCLAGATLWSCSDDDKESAMTAGQLPENAKTFLNTYYSGVEVAYVNYDKDNGVSTYDVSLANGHKVEFSSTGEWISVEATHGQTVPASLVPAAIAEYVAANYSDLGVNEISRVASGYDVELTDETTTLLFNADGSFLGIGH